MARSLIGLGSNLGDRATILHQALQLFEQHIGIVHAASSFFPTRPVGGPANQPEYLNAAAVCECKQPPSELLAALQSLERQFGRQRDEKWSSRTLDLDLLLYDQVVQATPELTLPHPRMAFRRFVLQPAAEVAPQMIHPPTEFTILDLLQRLDVKPIHIAVLGEQAELIVQDAAARSGSCALLQSSLIAGRSAERNELLELVQPALDAWKLATQNHPRAIVSDFWIGAFTPSTGPAAGQTDFSKWSTVTGTIPQEFGSPHLVVWLEPNGGLATVEGTEALRQTVFRKRQFPVLVLHRATITSAAAEIVAAIEAME